MGWIWKYQILNERNDNYWFCPDCTKPALTAIFIDKDIREKCQKYFKSLEPRIIKYENDHEDMSNLLSGKVESVKFSEPLQQNTTKIEELESNIASLKGDIKSLPGKSSAPVQPRKINTSYW